MSKAGNYRTLVKSGEATDAECVDAWEKIVEKNEYHSGNRRLEGYKILLAQLNASINEQIAVVSTIDCLTLASWLKYERNEEQLKFLKSKGYKIDTSSDEAYLKSLTAAAHQSGKINTRIKIKLNQINNIKVMAEQAEQGSESNLDDILTALSMEVGYQLPDQITLAQYNAYAKRIKKKHEALERSKRKNGHTA